MSLDASPQPRPDRRKISRSDAMFWRVTGAFFFGGFATFALLYSVQPLMPVFAREFAVSPALASLSLSASTLVLAVAMIVRRAPSPTSSDASASWPPRSPRPRSPPCSARWRPTGRRCSRSRALTGLALAGLPAVAMAYLGDEMDAQAIGLAMGLYIAGSTLGGMAGRLAVAALSDRFGWRIGIAALGVVGFAGAALIAFALPTSRKISPRRPDFGDLAASLVGQFSDPGLRLLFAEGFLLLGSFVCAYNYIGFRLMAAPFSLSQTTIGFVFALYLVGAVSLDGHGGPRRPLRAPARDVDRHRHRGFRRRGDAARQHRRRRRRRRPDHLGILRRPFDRLELGRPAGARRARAGFGALPVLLLRRVEPGGLGGRPVLRLRRLAGRRRALVGAVSVLALAHRAAPFQSPAAAPSSGLEWSGAMEWRDEGIVIGVRRHGETSAIVEAMTRAHGRHLGLVRGGRSTRSGTALQPGNTLGLVWRARLDEHLGAYAVEPLGAAGGAPDRQRAWRSPASAISARCCGCCPSATRTRGCSRR